MCAVRPEGVPQLCKADEIGELCVCTVATGTAYYGLTGMTKNTFEVRRLGSTRIVKEGTEHDFHSFHLYIYLFIVYLKYIQIQGVSK